MTDLHHVVAGRGPTLLLGSSLGTTHEMWAPQIDVLAEHFRVVAYDHRGHGGSPVPPGSYTLDDLGFDVLGLLDRLGVDRFRYAGLSLGGMVGMWLAATVPDRVERLALLCTSARMDEARWRERAAAVRRAGTAAVADAVVERWFTPRFHADNADVVARHRAMLLAVSTDGYAGCCDAIAEMDLRDRLADVRTPALVIAGEADQATPVSHAEDIVRRIDGARLVVVPDCAHLANVERPDAVTHLLTEHLRGDEDRRRPPW